MAHHDIVGTWRLQTYTRRVSGNKVSYPFGQHPRGYITYTPEGIMVTTVMPERRARGEVQHDDLADPIAVRSWLSVRRIKRLVRYVLAATRYISYSGRYTITEHTIIHHVEVSQMPGLIHTDQERTYELQGNRLVLTAHSATVTQQFTWERVVHP